MSATELRLSALVGRRVRDADGRPVGRIEELICEIELHERGRDYVVRAFRVGTFGWLDALTGPVLARELVRTLGRAGRYRHRDVGWQQLDLTDPAHPRLRGGS